MDEWMETFAAALGERPLDQREIGAILKMARDVAHGVERKVAPLAAFVAGLHVGRSVAAGTLREAALEEALGAARALIPIQTEPG